MVYVLAPTDFLCVDPTVSTLEMTPRTVVLVQCLVQRDRNVPMANALVPSAKLSVVLLVLI